MAQLRADLCEAVAKRGVVTWASGIGLKATCGSVSACVAGCSDTFLESQVTEGDFWKGHNGWRAGGG